MPTLATELAPLLRAIAAPQGGGLALVVGAGCSAELPTGLPTAKQCAIEAHRRLMEDHLLDEGECVDPSDLSLLADVVWDKYGSQEHLVERLPRTDFLLRPPNEGYKIAAALLTEHAIVALLTLNFDHAIITALSSIAAKDVAVVMGPQQHDLLAAVNVIYLHRDVNAPADEWILRTASLQPDGYVTWQALIADKVAAVPVLAFVGLGSPAGVLTEAVRRLKLALTSAVIFHVDPHAKEAGSPFATSLQLADNRRISMRWGEFMQALAERLGAEHVHIVRSAETALAAKREIAQEDTSNLLTQLEELGLLGMGRVRARWLHGVGEYTPMRGTDPELLADLTGTLAALLRGVNTAGRLHDDGAVELKLSEGAAVTVIPASGRGTESWLEVEGRIRSSPRFKRDASFNTVVALVSAAGAKPQVSAPENVVDEKPDDLVSGGRQLIALSADDVRVQPAALAQALAL